MPTIAIDAVGIGQPGGGRSATMNLLGALLRQDRSTSARPSVSPRKRSAKGSRPSYELLTTLWSTQPQSASSVGLAKSAAPLASRR